MLRQRIGRNKIYGSEFSWRRLGNQVVLPIRLQVVTALLVLFKLARIPPVNGGLRIGPSGADPFCRLDGIKADIGTVGLSNIVGEKLRVQSHSAGRRLVGYRNLVIQDYLYPVARGYTQDERITGFLRLNTCLYFVPHLDLIASEDNP